MPRRSAARRRVGAIAAAVVAVFAGSSSCADPVQPGICAEPVYIRASSGSVPEFDWRPRCYLSGLTVNDAAGREMWTIYGGVGENELGPPVRYGAVAPGVTETKSPEQLVPGVSYRVRVFWLVQGDGEIRWFWAGEASFEP